jgi:uncharacterized protein (TIGR00369 family)
MHPDGRTRIGFDARPEFADPAGFVQPGLLAAMLDETMGPGVVAAHGGDAFTPTLELSVSFLKPARPGRLTGEGRIVHLGRSTVFLAGSLIDDNDDLVATATSTSRLRKFDESTQPPVPDEIPAASEMPATGDPLGRRVADAERGLARLDFESGEQLLNPNGVVQGGFLTAMLDETMVTAAETLLEPGLAVASLELKTSYLQPARPGLLRCQARVAHRGRSIVFSEATLSDASGQMLAGATGTAAIVPAGEREQR